MKPPGIDVQSQKLSLQVTLAVLVTFIGMAIYESLKQFAFPAISIWQSHATTILFSCIVAGVGAFVTLQKRERLLRQLVNEINERSRIEEELRKAKEDLETRVAARTSELARANTELRESETRYRAISELVSDCAFSLRIKPDQRAEVEWATDAFTRITGYTLAEMQALGGLPGVAHPDDRSATRDFWASLLAGQSGACEFRAPTKTGQMRWLRVYGRPITDPATGDIARIYGAVEDITERVQIHQSLEQRVEERTRELGTLLQVSQSVASTLELKPLVGVILGQLKTMVDYTGAAIWIRQGDELSLLDCRGPLSADQTARLEAVGYDQVTRDRTPMIVPDIWDDSELARPFREAGEPFRSIFAYAHSWMGVPLLVKERLLGVLRLDHAEPNHFTPHDAHLALAIGNQAAIAIENARLYERAQKLAVLEERQRLARELHDSISQALYGIELGARTARELVQTEGSGKNLKADLAEPMEYVLRMARASLAEMRALIFELRPESLQAEGLVAGLSKQVASLRDRHRLKVESTLGDEPDLPLELKEATYRVAREAMHNIVKHAHASHVDLSLDIFPDRVVLHVRDDGVGFDALAAYPGHLGLQSMRERVASLGGALEIQSVAGRGTRICADIPIKPGQC